MEQVPGRDLEKYNEEVHERLINDTNRLLTIFPEELWRTIMDVTTDPQILESFCNVSPFFRNILDSRRSQFLFGRVWEIIEVDFTADTVDDYDKIKGRMGDEAFERHYGTKCVSCGLTRYPRWFSSILNLRLVCKSWCSGIDAFNQNHPRHFRMEAEAAYGYDDTSFVENICFEWSDNSFVRDSGRFEKFLKHFGNTHGSPEVKRNPFLSRSVDFETIASGNFEFPPEYTKKVKRFLEKYGHHIWYSRLCWKMSILMYPVIREWLFLMPNLKVLKLVGIDFHDTGAWCRRERLETLESNPDSCVLPQFKDLQFLSADNLPKLILDGFLHNNPHISKLLVDWDSLPNVYKFDGIQLPNLKHFCYKLNSEGEFHNFQVSTTNWPLTNVYLNSREFLSIKWKNLFVFLHRWGNTLENLNIFIANTTPITAEDFNWESSIQDLKFPNLTRFKLITYYFPSLDFLLFLKDTLEILDVCVLYKGREYIVEKSVATEEAVQNQKVQFLGYQERLLQSNIWELFPKLKRVLIFEFDWDCSEMNLSWVYDRKEWENTQREIENNV